MFPQGSHDTRIHFHSLNSPGVEVSPASLSLLHIKLCPVGPFPCLFFNEDKELWSALDKQASKANKREREKMTSQGHVLLSSSLSEVSIAVEQF